MDYGSLTTDPVSTCRWEKGFRLNWGYAGCWAAAAARDKFPGPVKGLRAEQVKPVKSELTSAHGKCRHGRCTVYLALTENAALRNQIRVDLELGLPSHGVVEFTNPNYDL